MINYSKGLTVDSLSYKNVSLMLQQAAEITGGIAISVDNFQDFTEALQRFVFIDDFKDCFDRPKFEQNVDHRALCFCHQKIVNTGFACSVCFSLFCKKIPICIICGTSFKKRRISNNE